MIDSLLADMWDGILGIWVAWRHTNKLVFVFALLLLWTVQGEVNVVNFLSGLFRMGKGCWLVQWVWRMGWFRKVGVDFVYYAAGAQIECNPGFCFYWSSREHLAIGRFVKLPFWRENSDRTSKNRKKIQQLPLYKMMRNCRSYLVVCLPLSV